MNPVPVYMIAERDALALAVRGGRSLAQAATPTTFGIRFPEFSQQGEVEYWENLYRGAAGVGITLLDLFLATGDETYSRLAAETCGDLVESVPYKFHLHPGLYAGHGGVALFHLAAARVLRNPLFLREALRLADRLTELPFRGTDLIAGAAGTGLMFLSFFQATEDERYLRAAGRAVAYLKETAEESGNALFWAPLVPEWGDSLERYIPHTGLSHGVAGICLFLAEMARTTEDSLVEYLCRGGFNWLDRKRIETPAGFFWPVSLTNPKLRYHWCHGSAGIAHAYLALFRQTRDSRAMEAAVGAARASLHLLRQQPREALIYCHGLSGILELFVELEALGAEGDWGRTAAGYLPEYARFFDARENSPPPKNREMSLALGEAGMVRLLLRLAGKANLSIHVLCREALGFSPSEDQEPIFAASPKSRLSGQGRSVCRGEDRLKTVGKSEFLPFVGMPLGGKSLLWLRPPSRNERRSWLHEISSRRLLRPSFLSALRGIRRAAARFERDYAPILKPGVLGDHLHAPVLRELCGLGLQSSTGGPDPGKLIHRLTTQYISALELFLSRLAKDREGVLSSEVGGRVSDLEIFCSDPHRRGQKVISMRFEGGQEFIYKARSVGLERYLIGSSQGNGIPSLAEWVNARLKPHFRGARLATHRIIPAGEHYGYAERIITHCVPTKPIAREKFWPPGLGGASPPIRGNVLKKPQERRFWYSAGLLAGFAAGFGLGDLHDENVICGASASTQEIAFHPIDIETAFHEFDCLRDTLLVDLTALEEPEKHARGIHKHSGFDNEVKLCGTSSEPWVFRLTPEGYRLSGGSPVLASLDFPYLVQNQDGSLGYGSNLLWLLRGMVDVWETLRSHVSELTDYLKEHLTGIPVRVLAKATRLYIQMQRKYRGLAYPSPGASSRAEFLLPWPLFEEEVHQLRAGDIPYFFRTLSDGERDLGIRWFKGRPEGRGAPAELERVYAGLNPFWSIVERQTRLDVLVRSLADAIAFGAPPSVFDLREERSGLRVFRPEEGSKIWFVLLLRDGRLTGRIEGEGGVTMWKE